MKAQNDKWISCIFESQTKIIDNKEGYYKVVKRLIYKEKYK